MTVDRLVRRRCGRAIAPYLPMAPALVLVAVFLMTPTVFFSLQRMFDWGDILYDRLHTWLSRHRGGAAHRLELPPK